MMGEFHLPALFVHHPTHHFAKFGQSVMIPKSMRESTNAEMVKENSSERQRYTATYCVLSNQHILPRLYGMVGFLISYLHREH